MRRLLVVLALLLGSLAVGQGNASATIYDSGTGTWCQPGTNRCVAIKVGLETAIINGKYLVRARVQWWCYHGGTTDGDYPCYHAYLSGVGLFQPGYGIVGGWEGQYECYYGPPVNPLCPARITRVTSWHNVGGNHQYYAQAGYSDRMIVQPSGPDPDTLWAGIRVGTTRTL